MRRSVALALENTLRHTAPARIGPDVGVVRVFGDTSAGHGDPPIDLIRHHRIGFLDRANLIAAAPPRVLSGRVGQADSLWPYSGTGGG
jgi:hypothetical protein